MHLPLVMLKMKQQNL